MVKIQRVYTTIPFVLWGAITSLLPLTGFVMCVVIAIMYHFEQSTKTHCRVWNFLPSISAAVGDSTPERYIWRFCIAYHCLPRTFIIPAFYGSYYADYAARLKSFSFSFAYKAALALNVIENFFLVLLTMVSSHENYPIHEKSFISFMACATFYMFLTLYVQNTMRKTMGLNPAQMRAFKIKIFACVTNISVFLFSIYLFVRHNTYCEPGVYSWYAACEYYIVFSNILFHTSAIVEFPRLCAVIADVDDPPLADKASAADKPTKSS